MLQVVAQGKFNYFNNLITYRFPLKDFVEKGLETVINSKAEHSERIYTRILRLFSFSDLVKVLVYPRPDLYMVVFRVRICTPRPPSVTSWTPNVLLPKGDINYSTVTYWTSAAAGPYLVRGT